MIVSGLLVSPRAPRTVACNAFVLSNLMRVSKQTLNTATDALMRERHTRNSI